MVAAANDGPAGVLDPVVHQDGIGSVTQVDPPLRRIDHRVVLDGGIAALDVDDAIAAKMAVDQIVLDQETDPSSVPW
ncbi:MAG: hypothetical protein R3D03_04695 [Geminicoccaceae bacterium]